MLTFVWIDKPYSCTLQKKLFYAPKETMSTQRTIITIDGPTASGKSTIAQLLAQDLGIYFLGTGLMFRGLAYLLVERAGYTEAELYFPRSEDLAAYGDRNKFVYEPTGKIFFEGEDLTPFLKMGRMDSAASIVSTNRAVREVLLNIQRACAEHFSLVAEGRDVGSVVFPSATAKFFLTASLAVRARRWQADQARRGHHVTIEQAMQLVSERDQRDSEREVAPLIKPADAVEIDNSDLDALATVMMMKSFMK